MDMAAIPFGTTDLSEITPTRHVREKCFALWRTRQCGNIRVSMAEYSAEISTVFSGAIEYDAYALFKLYVYISHLQR
ncbi:hypothetical protein [Neptunomonas antarctica]|uniref:Uncharacterized protein n=1 Tax=Neptunomonas antarctica TaxID=619304 RepID=A0A1N7NT80_9GAMM|nr:hypothetical protein [Neptunomonas antarctica]SIT01544.1 hypothetical protein SAMN05421760_11117 [Neptunomonas antarctica]